MGLWSYYNFDNWTYQPSYISSDTPWYFSGLRVQIFVNRYLKLEPWLVNGWQSYGKFNEAPGGGFQLQWRPFEWLGIVANEYVGTDTLGVPDRVRVHTDESIMARFFSKPGGAVSKAAGSLTIDAGCEQGGDGKAHTTCGSQYVLGFMAYARLWLWGDKIGLTAGGGAMRNPGRYIVLLPPINGATAVSGTPYFTTNPGDRFDAWDFEATGDYMPGPFTTVRLEFAHRAANVPYFTGHGGVTPPGGDQGAPGSVVSGWSPRSREDRESPYARVPREALINEPRPYRSPTHTFGFHRIRNHPRSARRLRSSTLRSNGNPCCCSLRASVPRGAPSPCTFRRCRFACHRNRNRQRNDSRRRRSSIRHDGN